MNWINSLPWYQWVILGMVPPLIFSLYFLKLRRTSLEVPSTYLWKKTVEDMHVNSLWQKLRKNLLLLLQLLAVLALILSCLRPGCDGTKLIGDRFIFVIDQSASMSATDTENGLSRLEESKKQIVQLIDRMKPTDAAMIISFSDRADVHQSYTTNQSVLKRKVNLIKQTQRSSDINEALLAASGLANPGRTSDRNSQSDVQVADAMAAKLYIFSDGAVTKIPTFFLGNLTPEYHPIGAFEIPDNVGITAFSINSQNEWNGQVQIFARLQNSGMEDTTVNISLFVDDELIDAREVTVKGLGATPLNFDLTTFANGLETATPIRLQIDDKDIYMQDNEAYTVLSPPRIANVLIVTDHNSYLKFATQTERIKKSIEIQFENRDYLKGRAYREKSTLGAFDLIIYDQCAPESMPACNTVFFGALPPGDAWETVLATETTPIVDVNSAHPLMFNVMMGNVNILNGTTLKGPQGSESLIESVSGSIMMIGPRAGFEDLIIGFPLIEYTDDNEIEVNTDWPTNLSFPFFIQNLMNEMAGGARFHATRNHAPGELVKIKPHIPFPSIDVKSPDGQSSSLLARPDSSFVFAGTDDVGIYEVRGQGDSNVDHLFAVNLLDRLESDLTVRDKLNLGYEEVAGTISSEPARKDFWTWLVLLALLIISIEWFIYNRRVFI